MLRPGHAIALAAAGAAAMLVASVLPLVDDGGTSVTLAPVADTTVTQVAQDGDNGVKSTLASCPRRCDRNPDGQRDALLQFAVTALPADAVAVRATLRVYAWQSVDAEVSAHRADGTAHGPGTGTRRPPLGPALDTVRRVEKGHNEWDVSAVIKGNGSYTFALTQQEHPTRIYWASRDNARPELRPQLVLTYDDDRPGVPPIPRASTPGWRLVWSDEFTGPTLDRTKWNLRTSEGRDVDRGCNTDSPRNTFVADGLLTMRALRETATCSSQTRQYTQSYLDTIGRHFWTYGRFEIRAKSPNGPDDSRGLWPAFWLRPEDGGKGEIDVVELPGGSGYYRAATQAIFYDYTPVKQDHRYAFPSGYPGDGFHTYTTEWEPDAIRWYIDGRTVYERTRATTPWFDEVFHKPYNLRLNVQVGGWLGDPDPSTVFPADFVVDYVRVWQR